MKQIGNLAVICGRRPDVLMQVFDGRVAVYAGSGPQRTAMLAQWDDDAQIDRIIYELKFGAYKKKEAA